MKSLLTVSLISTGLVLSSGCATKKYVRTQTAPIQAKADQVGEQTNRNTSSIDETNKGVKDLDERTAAGISSAKERAAAAEARANEGVQKAEEAATLARTLSDENRAELAGLRDTIANIDDYQLHKETTVQFGFDKSSLTDDSKRTLDDLAGEATAWNRYVISVKGYTDRIGPADYNAALSQRRADSVVRYLVGKHNMPLQRVYTLGLGKENPLDESGTRDARAKNRRVEVKVFVAGPVERENRPKISSR